MALEQDLLLWQIEVDQQHRRPGRADAIPGPVRDGHADRYRLGMALRRSLDRGQLPRLHDAGADPLRRPPRAERRPTCSGRGRGRLRLGKPRLPGIQRDADTEPMSLAYELPRHVSQDTVYPYRAARGRDRAEHPVPRCRPRRSRSWSPRAEIALHPASEVTLGAFELRAGQVIELDLRLDALDQAGVVLHPRQPSRLAPAGRRRPAGSGSAISGEKEYCARDLVAGRWYDVTRRAGRQIESPCTSTATRLPRPAHWSASPRWKALSDGTTVTIADNCSPRAPATDSTSFPTSVETAGAGARADVDAAPRARQQTITIGVVCAYGDDALEADATAARAAQDFGSRARQLRGRLPGSVAQHVHAGQPPLQRPPAHAPRRPTRASRGRTTWPRCWLSTCATPGSARQSRSS